MKYLLFNFIFILISIVSVSLYVAVMVICLRFYLLLVIYILSVTGYIVLFCYSHISNSTNALQGTILPVFSWVTVDGIFCFIKSSVVESYEEIPILLCPFERRYLQ